MSRFAELFKGLSWKRFKKAAYSPLHPAYYLVLLLFCLLLPFIPNGRGKLMDIASPAWRDWAFYLALVVFLVVFLFASDLAFQKRLAALKSAAYEKFRTLKYAASDERFAFDAAQATIVHESLQLRAHNAVIFQSELTLYARNPSGEHFMVVLQGNDQKPFFKHVSKEMMELVLADR